MWWQYSRLVFEKCPFRISAEYRLNKLGNCAAFPNPCGQTLRHETISSRAIPSKFFSIHHSAVFLQFDATQSEMPTQSQNKTNKHLKIIVLVLGAACSVHPSGARVTLCWLSAQCVAATCAGSEPPRNQHFVPARSEIRSARESEVMEYTETLLGHVLRLLFAWPLSDTAVLHGYRPPLTYGAIWRVVLMTGRRATSLKKYGIHRFPLQ